MISFEEIPINVVIIVDYVQLQAVTKCSNISACLRLYE